MYLRGIISVFENTLRINRAISFLSSTLLVIFIFSGSANAAQINGDIRLPDNAIASGDIQVSFEVSIVDVVGSIEPLIDAPGTILDATSILAFTYSFHELGFGESYRIGLKCLENCLGLVTNYLQADGGFSTQSALLTADQLPESSFDFPLAEGEPLSFVVSTPDAENGQTPDSSLSVLSELSFYNGDTCLDERIVYFTQLSSSESSSTSKIGFVIPPTADRFSFESTCIGSCSGFLGTNFQLSDNGKFEPSAFLINTLPLTALPESLQFTLREPSILEREIILPSGPLLEPIDIYIEVDAADDLGVVQYLGRTIITIPEGQGSISYSVDYAPQYF